MPDVYAAIAEAGEEVQARLSDVLELRAADLQQRAMLEDYLADLVLPDSARVLEIGAGTGPVARMLAAREGVGEVVGLDPCPLFVEEAQIRGAGIANLSFVVGDGRELPFADGSFDVVVCHTSLCHIPGPDAVLTEAHRVTGPSGLLAIFDGDYATTTVAVQDQDPLQACAEAAIGALVYDPWLVRRLPGLVRDAGYAVVRVRSHGYVETADPQYTLTIVDRGDDDHVAAGERLGGAVVVGMKDEPVEVSRPGRHVGLVVVPGGDYERAMPPTPIGLGGDIPRAVLTRPGGDHLRAEPDVLAKVETVGEALEVRKHLLVMRERRPATRHRHRPKRCPPPGRVGV